MIKFLINFGSLLLCLVIIGLGVFLTLQQSRLDDVVSDITAISEMSPVIGGSSDSGVVKPVEPEEDDLGNGYDPTPDIPGEDIGNIPTDPEIPGHDHTFVDGKCECGESDPDYVPDTPAIPDAPVRPDPDKPTDPEQPSAPTLSTEEAKEAYKELYDNNDPTFSDMKKEVLVDLITGALTGGSNNDSGSSGTPDGGETTPDGDPDLGLDDDFSTDFNPDEFEPDDEPEEDQVDNEIKDLIADVCGTYFDNLQKEIQANQEANSEGTEEEKAVARDEFVEKEAEAFAGLVNVVTKPEETTEDDLLQSVDAIISSPVCKETVSQSVENNPDLTEKVQQATENLGDELKSEIQSKLEQSLASDPEGAKAYQNIADLFGIILGIPTPDSTNP